MKETLFSVSLYPWNALMLSFEWSYPQVSSESYGFRGLFILVKLTSDSEWMIDLSSSNITYNN